MRIHGFTPRPGHPAHGFVQSVFEVRSGHRAETVLTKGNVDLLFNLGDPIEVSLPDLGGARNEAVVRWQGVPSTQSRSPPSSGTSSADPGPALSCTVGSASSGPRAMMRRAFPDISVEVGAMAVDGDQRLTHAVLRGTHRGEFMGIPATGRRVEVGLADRIRFRDGHAGEHWGITDMMAMMQQLGVIDPES